jgi:DNA-binding CsgD family transcriptional regulator
MGKGYIGIDSFREVAKNLPYDNALPKYKQELFNAINSNSMVVLNNQFFYITDIQSFNNVCIHKNLKHVLGYEPDHFKSMENIYKTIHPEDHDFVLAFSKKTVCYSREAKVKPLLIKDPFKIVFSIDFRMRKSDGKYIRVNRLSSCVNLDKQGNMVYAIAIYTDIDHLKKANNVSYSWSGDDLGLFSVEDLIKEYPASLFSHREIEVLKYIAEGLDGKLIAKKLNLSEHTVISHRKKMLRKAQVKNTAELVRYAIQKGIISVSYLMFSVFNELSFVN